MPTRLPHVLAVLLSCATSVACAQAGDPPSAATSSLTFDGVTYVHRWSEAGQHEFTPEGDDDLDRWTDMVTVNVHASVRDGEQLAVTANTVLSNYEGAGEILRTASRPRTASAPAEHFIAAVLRGPTFLEAAFARVMLVGGQGVVVVYSHRAYGPEAGRTMAEWVQAEGTRMEDALMGWGDAPSVVRALPGGG